MRAKSIPRERQYELVLECRKSGLPDRQWCQLNDINPGTFYNWVKRFRQDGTFDIPESDYHVNKTAIPQYQDVVRIDVLPDFTKGADCAVDPNRADNISYGTASCDIELILGPAHLRIDNSAEPGLVSCIIRTIGGLL